MGIEALIEKLIDALEKNTAEMALLAEALATHPARVSESAPSPSEEAVVSASSETQEVSEEAAEEPAKKQAKKPTKKQAKKIAEKKSPKKPAKKAETKPAKKVEEEPAEPAEEKPAEPVEEKPAKKTAEKKSPKKTAEKKAEEQPAEKPSTESTSQQMIDILTDVAGLMGQLDENDERAVELRKSVHVGTVEFLRARGVRKLTQLPESEHPAAIAFLNEQKARLEAFLASTQGDLFEEGDIDDNPFA